MKDLEWPHDTIEYKKKKFIEKTEREKLRLAINNAGDNSSVFNVSCSYSIKLIFIQIVRTKVLVTPNHNFMSELLWDWAAKVFKLTLCEIKMQRKEILHCVFKVNT